MLLFYLLWKQQIELGTVAFVTLENVTEWCNKSITSLIIKEQAGHVIEKIQGSKEKCKMQHSTET